MCSKTAAIPEVRGVPPPVILRSVSDEGSVFPAAGDWDGKRSFAALRMTRTGDARDDEDGGMLSIARPGNTRDDKPGLVWYTVGRGRKLRHRRGEERT